MRIGCLSAAKIAPKALVHPARAVGGVTLQAIAARDFDRARAFAQAHGFAQALDTYDALIASDEIDLIYNPLPIHLHAKWTIRALEAGKHVLCEKPFAMNAQEARDVLDAAKASGKRVIEAFHSRYHPAFRQVLDWIDGGKIGAVRRIEARFNVQIDDRDGAEIRHLIETGGGAFMDLGCYPLHWTLSVLDHLPITVSAEATLTPRGVDETMSALLTFDFGVQAQLKASMAKGEAFQASLHVHGHLGSIQVINPLSPHTGASVRLTRGEDVIQVPVSRISTYTYQLAAVLEALETGEPLPTEGEIVLRQQTVLDAIYEAAGLAHLRQSI